MRAVNSLVAGLIGFGAAVACVAGLGVWARKRRSRRQDGREELLERYRESVEARRKAAVREAFLRGHRHGYREGRAETLDTLFGGEEEWEDPLESPADEAVRKSNDLYEGES